MNIFLYILFFYIIILSVIGYGLFFKTFFLKKNNVLDLGFIGFYGIFFLTLISYVISIFSPISENINLIIAFVGLVSFVFFQKKIKKYDFILLFIIFFLLIFFIIGSKNHDDFPYYHYAYIDILNKERFEYGVGHFNHGFRTHSSIFYLGSLLNLPLTNQFLIHLSPALFMGFSNFIFLKYLLKKKSVQILKKEKLIISFTILIFSFINIFFYRLAEHGTDRSGQVLSILFVYVLINIILTKDKKKINDFTQIFILLLILSITLKPLFIVYSIFIFYIFLYKLDYSIILIKNQFRSITFYLSLFLLSLYFFTNLKNTGCLLYPLAITCLENLEWSISLSEVKKMSLWYELWSKAGANPNFRVDNFEHYVSNFNWVPRWIDDYFFNKVSDFLLSLFFILLFFKFFFQKKENIKVLNLYDKRKIYFILICLILLVFEWFLQHPSLRYGGYSIIALFSFLIFLKFYSKNLYFTSKKITIWIMIIFSVFLLRNFIRIGDEMKQYNLNIFENASYSDNFKNKNLYKQIIKVKFCKEKCESDIKFNKNYFYKE